MCQSTDVIRLVLRAATTKREQLFVWLAVDTYLQRILAASEQKLIAHGMRPFVTPVAAELALDRAQQCNGLADYLTRLIDHDDLIADLVLRSIRFYSARFAAMSNAEITAELGITDNSDLNTAALVIQRNLSFITPTFQHSEGDTQ